MRISLDQLGGRHVVHAHAPWMVRIGDRTFTRSLIVTASKIVEDWPPLGIEDLGPGDLEPLLVPCPEVLLIGSGPRQAFPGREVLAVLYGARVGFEIMTTPSACRTYNILVCEGRDVVAAFILGQV